MKWRKDGLFVCLFSIKAFGKTGQLPEKNEIRPLSYTVHAKISSKWIKDLKMRFETIKLIKEHTDSSLLDIGIFMDLCPQGRETKAEIKLLGRHQNKKLLHSEQNNQQIRKTTH